MFKIVSKLINKNNYFDIDKEAEDLLLSHPNYPSLFAITDTLDNLFIENAAIKVPSDQLSNLPTFFLAVVSDEIVFVNKEKDKIEVHFQNETNKLLTSDEFIVQWNGVVVIIESNNTIEFKVVKNNYNWIKYTLPAILLIALSFQLQNYDLTAMLILGTTLFGFIVSIFIVQEKFGLSNEVISKLCKLNTNTSCNSVIKSSKSSINKLISFSDLPLLFFGTNFLSILIKPISASILVEMISLLAIPIIIYSIWLQKVEIKKWCVLCLVVSFIILIQAFFLLFHSKEIVLNEITNSFIYLFSFFTTTSVWLIVKSLVEEKIKSKNTITELKKFKRNPDIFLFLLKDIPLFQGFEKLRGLSFGNVNANVQLTLFLSPTCNYCHKSFEDSLNLITKYPDKVGLNIMFNINPENKNNDYKIVVENLLQINHYYSIKSLEAISDWHIKRMDIETWKKKWEVNLIDISVNHQIQEQYNWCLKNEFNYTPVKIINDKLLSSDYEINELHFFLKDLDQVNNDLIEDRLQTN